jgi:hypothetical protein
MKKIITFVDCSAKCVCYGPNDPIPTREERAKEFAESLSYLIIEEKGTN